MSSLLFYVISLYNIFTYSCCASEVNTIVSHIILTKPLELFKNIDDRTPS